jgi:hypothetical protein
MADADDLPNRPPGTSGPSNGIAATVEAAKAAGMANVLYLEQSTHTAGESIGDLMPLPQPPFHDTSVLGGEPQQLGGAS